MRASPFLIALSLLVTGCTSTTGPSRWTWPWKSSNAPASAQSNPAQQTSPFAQSALASPSTEWPDEKRATSDVKVALAQMLDKQGAVDDAIPAYEKLLQDSPNNAAITHRLAVLHDTKGQPDQAEPHYQHALRLTPQDARLLADYGYHCYLQRRWSDAESHLTRSLQIDPHQPRTHGNLALVLARTQRLDPALREFAAAGCSPADAHSNVAFALAAESQMEQAEQHYRTALSYDPHHKRSQDALTAIGGARHKASSMTRDVIRASAEQPEPASPMTSRRMGNGVQTPVRLPMQNGD